MSNTLGFVLIFLTDKSFVISTRFIVCYFIVDVFIFCSVSVLVFLSAVWILHIISSINFTISNLHVDLFYHIIIIFFLSLIFLLTFSTTSVSVFLAMPFKLLCSTSPQETIGSGPVNKQLLNTNCSWAFFFPVLTWNKRKVTANSLTSDERQKTEQIPTAHDDETFLTLALALASYALVIQAD